jgi:Excalibur calcium-binding domain
VALNADYPHGVGRTGAVDHVSGSSKPVTTFTVNDAVYAANASHDGDGDGIACEKH